MPRKQPKDNKYQPPNTNLSNHADWTCFYIFGSKLKQFQFPGKVPTQKNQRLNLISGNSQGWFYILDKGQVIPVKRGKNSLFVFNCAKCINKGL